VLAKACECWVSCLNPTYEISDRFTDLLDRCFSNRWWPLVVGLRLMQMLRPVRFLALKLMTGLNGRVPALAAPLKRQKPLLR
jgi:hypothetical protein